MELIYGALRGALCMLVAAAAVAAPVTVAKKQLSTADVVARFQSSTGLVSTVRSHATATGSGFFVSGDGAFVTNWHVIEDALSIKVKRPDGGMYTVSKVLAADRERDVAILQVDGSGFTPAEFGATTAIRAGDPIIAIGNPFALEATVSTGVVSAIREVDGLRLIQITAPISPGSSGGALLSADGSVIGVTSYAITAGQNLNFALPIEYVRDLLAAAAMSPRASADAEWSSRATLPFPERKPYVHSGLLRKGTISLRTSLTSR